MSKVFYQLSNQGGLPSLCSLHLHLVARSGGTHARRADRSCCERTRLCCRSQGTRPTRGVGEELPFPGDASCTRDGRGAAPHGRCHQNEPPVLPGPHVSTPALGDPSAVQPRSPTVAFFSFKTGTRTAESNPLSFTLCHLGAFCHLRRSIGKPEIRKPINPVFPVFLNYTEIQGQIPT